MEFTKAIVRTPGKSLIKGIRGAGQEAPDYKKAHIQHRAYINALKQCGLDVKCLEVLEEFPDSTFVEDVALCTPSGTIICRPGAESRKKEVRYITEAIHNNFKKVSEIKSPGTVEAGDIMMADNHFFIGLSDRTNTEGANQIIAILGSYGYTATIVSIENILHLKTAVSYIENNNLLCWKEMSERTEFSKYNKIIVPDKERYAANSLWVNGTVIIPAGNPRTENQIRDYGYKTIELEMSEFRKLDGGLSCLSLRF